MIIDDTARMRPRLMSIAYRMLGSVVDAEDAVQDAFLRYQMTDDVSSPEGFLVRTTTNLCIDRLRLRQQREYIGPWVPEPVETPDDESDNMALSESLSQAFLLLLERLTADERAAFLLRVVFDYEYDELAEVIGKSEASARQLVSRARGRLGLEGDRRFPTAAARADQLAEQFVAACRSGDLKAVEDMLAADAEIHSDGGGKVSAARVVIRGPNRVARFLIGVFRKRWMQEVTATSVNGAPGLVFRNGDTVLSVLSMQIDKNVQSIYIIVNPDKLVRWSDAVIE